MQHARSIKNLVVTTIFLSVFLPSSISAINYGVAKYQKVEPTDQVQDGHIVSITGGRYILSIEEYDKNITGVVEMTPFLSLNQTEFSDTVPIITEGEVEVLVNQSNGPILVGDYITSSQTPGIGMKATEPGMIVGQALESFTPKDGQETTKITVAININYIGVVLGEEESTDIDRLKNFLNGIFRVFDIQDYDQPGESIKYIIASIVLLSSIVLAFSTFSRTARTGVEALGRNPLAGKSIAFGMILNVIITIVIIGAGFFIAYYILIM